MTALIENVNEQLPDIKFFSNFDALRLPSTSDDLQQVNYGNEAIKELGKHYDSPLVSSEDLKSEWIDYRNHMIRNCAILIGEGYFPDTESHLLLCNLIEIFEIPNHVDSQTS